MAYNATALVRLAALKALAAKTNPTAYVGQMLSVVVNGTATPYVIQNAAGDLAPLGAAAVTIASDDEANEMLTEIFGE